MRGKVGTTISLLIDVGIWLYCVSTGHGTLALFAFLFMCVCGVRLLKMRSERALLEDRRAPFDRFLLWCRRMWAEKPPQVTHRFILYGSLLLFFGAGLMIYGAFVVPNSGNAINPQNNPPLVPVVLVGMLLIAFGLPSTGIGMLLFFRSFRSATHGSAHFATLDEMKGAGLAHPLQGTRNCLEIGTYFHSRVGITEQQQESHVLVVAPSGKGKTSGIIVPALLNENGERSLVINDVKGELIATCAGALSQYYRVQIFAPNHPQHSHFYNPLAHLYSVEDAEDLADTWIANTGTSQSDPFWDRASAMLITAAILHVTRDMQLVPPFSTLSDLLTGKTLYEIQQDLAQSPSRLAQRSMVTFLNSISNNPKLGGSILLEIASRFRLLNNPGIQYITSKDEFHFDRFIDDPSAWFLSIPASEARRIKPLSACFLMQMMKRLTKRAETSQGGRLPYPVAFYMDEFANAGRIMHFEEYISLVRSAGIAFILAIQDFGQLNRVYGEDIANTIRANTETHIVFPGCGQVECQFYSDRIGDTTAMSLSSGYALIGEGVSFSFGDSETRRRLMNPDEIRTMPLGTLLVLHGNLPPLVVRNFPYYQRPDLTARVRLPFAYPTHLPSKPTALLPPLPAAAPPQSQQTPAGANGQSAASNDPFILP
jgi:type IV secretion system protein VirD4